ncbi:MAG: class II SORL domain-containing protein [Candidatus Atribacteria bacterium]|nr:class II SORL domain-containing protein [Candidatus Atribacteria bacterium]MCD6350211.1 class II SORL domain-containing protein [Candidatus Atribacteria bacterium]
MNNLGEFFQSADWRSEKHVPVIDGPQEVKAGDIAQFEVAVGKEISHPNTTEHHIRWLEVFFLPQGAKFPFAVARFDFEAHGESVEGPNKGAAYTEPKVSFYLKLNQSGRLFASSCCNIHDLWQSSKEITVN